MRPLSDYNVGFNNLAVACTMDRTSTWKCVQVIERINATKGITTTPLQYVNEDDVMLDRQICERTKGKLYKIDYFPISIAEINNIVDQMNILNWEINRKYRKTTYWVVKDESL